MSSYLGRLWRALISVPEPVRITVKIGDLEPIKAWLKDPVIEERIRQIVWDQDIDDFDKRPQL